MSDNLVLTVISDDKPGVVETLAQTITAYEGNWLESRMSHLAGKFAGILRIGISADKAEALRGALHALDKKGLKIVVESTSAAGSLPEYGDITFSIVGNDRPGIVHEIAQALSQHHINMEQLTTGYSSTPWSGEPLFEATGTLRVPKNVDLDELYEQLEKVADTLAIDIKLEEGENADQQSPQA